MRNLFSIVVATATILLTSTTLVHQVDAKCSSILTRREIRELSDSDRQSFFDAVKKMQAEKQPNKFDEFINYHITYSTRAHGVPAFLPWHREYLRRFDELIRSYGSNVPLPYWDWASDSQAPETAPIFQADWLGGNGKGSDRCVTDGQFSSYKPYYPSPGGCFSRAFDGKSPNTIGALYSSDFVAELQASSKDYDTFRRGYEGTAHARVHNAIGSSFSYMSSPGDLIFWLHHSLVDKHWAEWQALGHTNDYGPTSADEKLVPWDITAKSTFDTTAEPFCYVYSNMNARTAAAKNAPVPDASGDDDLGDMGSNLLRRSLQVLLRRRGYEAPAPAASGPARTTACGCKQQQQQQQRKDPLDYLLPDNSDRKNILSLRVPIDTPKWWAKMNNLPYEDIEFFQDRNRNLTKVLNNIPGYISQCAIFNRPDILAKLVKTTKDFIGYLNGKKIDFSIKCNDDPLKAVKEIRDQVVKFVKTSPDASEVVKLIGADAANLIQGYNGGNIIKSVTGKEVEVPSADQVSSMIAKLAGKSS
ncbi:hypothetical protein BDF22DRAFT_672114 [Syncephalis plumigaleata]|nr:hypothetical protein BDF22DRAFT_672114 [Syncephalis plumigaleata]